MNSSKPIAVQDQGLCLHQSPFKIWELILKRRSHLKEEQGLLSNSRDHDWIVPLGLITDSTVHLVSKQYPWNCWVIRAE